MIWLLLIPVCLLLAVALTWLAHRDMNRPAPKRVPCAHPWYIDGRCMVCGTPN